MSRDRHFSAFLAALLLAGFSLPATAIKTEPKIKEQNVTTEQTPGFVAIGHIPATAEQLVIMVESAKLKVIRSANTSNITISSNCPRNWNIKGPVIRQAGFAKARGGVSMMADALGSRAIVNGKVYVFPPGPIKGVNMGKDGVTVGGQKVEPLAGVDMPGTCDGADALEITVPESYCGSLMLGMAGDSDAVVDSWKGGKLEATMLGKSTLSAGKLKSLAKAVLDVRGQGKAEIGDLSTKVLVANINGSGSVTIKNGTAEISNATVAGEGTISLKGSFKNLQKVVDGKGSIQITD